MINPKLCKILNKDVSIDSSYLIALSMALLNLSKRDCLIPLGALKQLKENQVKKKNGSAA